jgi:two-component system C4-dicarboxylate transport response regulator DctD
MLSAGPFDLLISDIRMPAKSGFDLLELAHRHNPDLPVILMSGYPTDEMLKGCHSLGAAAYIMKPIRPKELLAIVHRVLQLRTMVAEHRSVRIKT